jgi:hypothetical protein
MSVRWNRRAKLAFKLVGLLLLAFALLIAAGFAQEDLDTEHDHLHP